MYKRIELKKDIGGYYIDDKYFAYTDSSIQGKIVVKRHTGEITYTSQQEWINGFCIVDDNLCYSSYDEDFSRIQFLTENKLIKLDTLLFGLTANTPNIYCNLYYNISEKIGKDKNSIYDLTKGIILEKINKEVLGFIELNIEKFIITKKETIIYCYTKEDFSLLWQKDISELTQYTEWDGSDEEGNIRQVYAYKDSIIVITQVFILRIDAQTGNIIYFLRLPAGLMSLSINGNKGYGCYGYHYMEIDLEKGELINFKRIENTEYDDKEYNTTMNKGTYHNGYVFHGLRLEGGQYAVGAINIATCEREWLDLLSVNMIEKIQFHNDKMFISDSGGNLFIYEKLPHASASVPLVS